ncbi:MAG: hypothetical protein HY897_19915 [Deltaproteobacteria bacterium]|nr:hypothetical protein [Deltaproteobacteria bacterium]
MRQRETRHWARTLFAALAGAAWILSAACVGPGTARVSDPGIQNPATRAVFGQLSAPEMPDGLADFLRSSPEWRTARLFSPADVRTDFDREWFFKTGYRSVFVDDIDNDGRSEIAAVLAVGSTLRLLIIRPGFDGWKAAYREDITAEQAMIRVEGLGGTAGSKCVLVASGQRGFRESVCWDGTRFVKITL